MWWHDHAQQELDHIKTAIFHLEHLGVSHSTAQSSAVMEADYWRKRIHKVLALPETPRQIEEQGLILLARLDRLHSAPRDNTGRN